LIDDNSIVGNGQALGDAAPFDGSFQGQTYSCLKNFPYIVSIRYAPPSRTDAGGVQFKVTFSEPVTGVDLADFAVVKTGTDASPTSRRELHVSPSVAGAVSVLLGNGDGTISSADHVCRRQRDALADRVDANVDAKPDLIASTIHFSTTGAVSVLLGTATGPFKRRARSLPASIRVRPPRATSMATETRPRHWQLWIRRLDRAARQWRWHVCVRKIRPAARFPWRWSWTIWTRTVNSIWFSLIR